ncbi:SURF1 family protein [Piscinibacter terrae]|uniref:SURF1-like protein n=1 Tax=Piscinibacter terrae TaxID=2496871 RepID=A0A3N7HKP5_9BURK|nr:SURF1 family protein [Albitalea terrae]RQP21576.1 SURF1 family protein [Albitalea terrae]
MKGCAIVVLVATLAGMALTARLGVWQLSRAAQKEALQQALDERAKEPELPMAAIAHDDQAAQAQHYRRTHLRGEWVASATVFLDNRQMNGRPGFYVVTPLKLGGTGESVAVQRGWVPRDQLDRTRLPTLPTPAGEVVVAGHIAPPPSRLYEFSAAASGPIRQNLDLGAFSVETGLRLLPVSLVQEDAPGAASDGLLRQWPRPAVDVHKHYGYAFQWFALCVLMAGLYVWFQLVRPHVRARQGRA